MARILTGGVMTLPAGLQETLPGALRQAGFSLAATAPAEILLFCPPAQAEGAAATAEDAINRFAALADGRLAVLLACGVPAGGPAALAARIGALLALVPALACRHAAAGLRVNAILLGHAPQSGALLPNIAPAPAAGAEDIANCLAAMLDMTAMTGQTLRLGSAAPG